MSREDDQKACSLSLRKEEPELTEPTVLKALAGVGHLSGPKWTLMNGWIEGYGGFGSQGRVVSGHL